MLPLINMSGAIKKNQSLIIAIHHFNSIEILILIHTIDVNIFEKGKGLKTILWKHLLIVRQYLRFRKLKT